MSVAGILSTAAIRLGTHLFQTRAHKAKHEFQKLGEDLRAGDLSAAQADFAALQKLKTGSSTNAADTVSSNFKQISADLKAGDTSSAQKDLTKLQQDLKNQAPLPKHSSNGDAIAQILTQVGSALQSGSLSAAQQAYNTMLTTFQQVATGTDATSSAARAISFNA